MNKFNSLCESLLNGLAKGKTLEDLAKKHNVDLEDLKKELQKGMNVEKEHTHSQDIAKEIAMDHLFEDPKYYTKLKEMESKNG